MSELLVGLGEVELLGIDGTTINDSSTTDLDVADRMIYMDAGVGGAGFARGPDPQVTEQEPEEDPRRHVRPVAP